MCSVTGYLFNHSIDEFVLFTNTWDRELDRASQIIHVNMITDKKEIKDPSEEIIFQVVKESG